MRAIRDLIPGHITAITGRMMMSSLEEGVTTEGTISTGIHLATVEGGMGASMGVAAMVASVARVAGVVDRMLAVAFFNNS